MESKPAICADDTVLIGDSRDNLLEMHRVFKEVCIYVGFFPFGEGAATFP